MLFVSLMSTINFFFCDSIVPFIFWILLPSQSAWNSCFRISAWQSARICSLCRSRRVLICSLSELCLWVSWTLETCESNVEPTTGLPVPSWLTDDDRLDDRPSPSERSARLRQVAGLITCERVVRGKGAKVLISESAQGICPPHPGRWSWWAGGRTRRERWRRKRWSEWRSRRDHSPCTWNMRMTMGWTKTQTWAGLSQNSVRASTKEDSQRTTTLTDNKKRDYENERSSMHEDSCIGINYAHMFPKCFRSLHTLLGFALYFVSSIQFLSLYQIYSIFELYANSL